MGLCFVEDICANGKKINRIIFDKYCRPINEANDYFWHIGKFRTNSYNTIKTYSNYMRYIYNFTDYYNLEVKKVCSEDLTLFLVFFEKN